MPALGADGNELASIRLPDIAVPLATYAGWKLYKAPFPEGALCDRYGSHVPLPATDVERSAKSDPRPSLQQLHRDHADCVAKLQAHAAQLVKARLLHDEDPARYVDAAKQAEVAKRFVR